MVVFEQNPSCSILVRVNWIQHILKGNQLMVVLILDPVSLENSKSYVIVDESVQLNLIDFWFHRALLGII